MALTAEEGPVVPVRGRQLADVLRPAAHHPGEVAGVAQAPDHDAVQVHGLDEVAEQRPLQAQHVPPAGEGGQRRPRARVGSPGVGPGAAHSWTADPSLENKLSEGAVAWSSLRDLKSGEKRDTPGECGVLFVVGGNRFLFRENTSPASRVPGVA